MMNPTTRFLALVAVLLLGVGMVAGRGNLVRGAHKPKGLKHSSMARMVDSTHAAMASLSIQEDVPRVLKKEDDQKDKDEVAAAEEEEEEDEKDNEKDEEEEEEDEKDNEKDEEEEEEEDEKDEEEEEEEDPEEAEEEEDMEPPFLGIVDDVVNATDSVDEPVGGNASDVVLPGETYEVVLDPFSLTVDSSINEEDLMLEEYLFNYMSEYLPNLVSVELTSETLEDDEDDSADEAPASGDENVTDSSRMLLRTSSNRLLQESVTIYYQGTATFEGPPKYESDEVDQYLTQALEDQEAILKHLESTPLAGTNSTITATPDAPKPEEVEPESGTTEGDKSEEDDGLSTTGLSIVIVAACVGGISLLIILMVGLSGPSGNTSGIKGGLPEQPKQ